MSRETDELAALLRELRERSGRSYGALGKRLHVSTSTVHRYCSGTAVPSEYAPLERLARVCGATADELVELHRRWILADASRRRRPSPSAGAGSAPTATGGRPRADEAPPARADGGIAVTASATPTADEDPEVPVPAEGSARGDRTADASDGAPTGEGRGAPAPETARTPRFRRRRVLFAAVAVAVAAVTVPAAVITATYSSSPSRHPLASGTTGRSTVSAPHGTVTGTQVAGSGKPTSTATVGPASSNSPAHTSSPSGPVTAPAAGSPPFHVNVLTNNWDSPCDQWFLLNRAPGAVPPPPASQATDGWAAALGAVPAGHLRLQVTVQGDDSRPVVLHALYVRVTGTRKAPAGNAYTMGSGCGGDLAPSSFAVDLDAQAPGAKAVPGHEGNITTRATDFPYKVSADDPEVLNIDAATVAQDVDWYLELSWSSGDRQGTTRIDDHGRPFRTAGMRGARAYWYDAAHANAWVPSSS
ncbi:hypothetical protein AAW14_09440 [Streptomyces hygroscopicus]|uniref:helix-turn-helix domain-containing protein n=1 Tax=Streptomyces hygroscopicus TaxID=1912 RepID=UPI00223EDB6F|nr:transcriptional regulator [Streptomyces hygroscopicus]MCW7942269.1 hypothetical protein [Streptomyces hygroscopicus]